MLGATTGEIVHVEIPSRDFARSAAFYAKLFGWKTDGVQSGGHLPFVPPGGIEGSWIRDVLAHAPGPVPFIAVADVDKALSEADKHGGRILVQRLTLPGKGHFGLLADCDGNVIGVLSSAQNKADKTDNKTDNKTDKIDKAPKTDKGEVPVKPAAKAAAAKKPSLRKR